MQLAGAQWGHPPGGEAANAGVWMLVRIGAVHATAAPAPMRLSAFRRETVLRSLGLGSSLMAPPSMSNDE
jgi:hypothetical protein